MVNDNLSILATSVPAGNIFSKMSLAICKYENVNDKESVPMATLYQLLVKQIVINKIWKIMCIKKYLNLFLSYLTHNYPVDK